MNCDLEARVTGSTPGGREAKRSATISPRQVHRFVSAPGGRAEETDGMNLLSTIAPTSVLADPVEGIAGRVAFTAAVKAVKAATEMHAELVRLLDPNVGKHLDRSA